MIPSIAIGFFCSKTEIFSRESREHCCLLVKVNYEIDMALSCSIAPFRSFFHGTKLLNTTARASICSLKGFNRDYGTHTDQKNPGYVVTVPDAKNFVKTTMIAVGAKEVHAQALADVLILADERGHYSHGLNRLGLFPVRTISLLYPMKCSQLSSLPSLLSSMTLRYVCRDVCTRATFKDCQCRE